MTTVWGRDYHTVYYIMTTGNYVLTETLNEICLTDTSFSEALPLTFINRYV